MNQVQAQYRELRLLWFKLDSVCIEILHDGLSDCLSRL
jgi:hypothetical protein